MDITLDAQQIDARIQATLAARDTCRKFGDDDGVELLTLEVDDLLEQRKASTEAATS